jgi:predicted kinase
VVSTFVKGRDGVTRYAIFVTGPPASGKSTVAEFLYDSLPDFALLQKDSLKEALFNGLQESGVEAATVSRRLSDAAIQLLWALAPRCPRVILEANFRTREPLERERFRVLDAKKLEVHCWCPPDVAMRRFGARAAERHPAHAVKNLASAVYEEAQAPFGLGPSMQLDTTNPVDLPGMLNRVRGLWPEL